ncbi:8936_t:CDS:2 [Cetraspora pellucida]|uniref:8936_t:CDS:1 n=1 Tax=Cetraspora pellucida TaxID=1433469 RepID=A0A9N9CN88_9GLOM|nr:8936_t:CDS:2 [Cetraspora pellucida]
MDTIPQYYQPDNMSMSKEPSQLSSNFVQPELSQLHTYTPMTDTGYPPDQFGMQQDPPPVSEPPPYDEFTGYNWVPAEMATFFPPATDDFGQNPLLNSYDEEFIFKGFLDSIQENPNFIFNPTLPVNMPPYPPPDNGINNSIHPMGTPSVMNNVYNPSQSHPSDILARHQFPSSNSTSLSPRTSNITLSPSPKHSPHDIRQSSQLISPIDDKDKSSVPAKRKQDGEDRTRRQPSNPRLSPINTKLIMTQSHSSTSSPRPISPSMQLSNLSINSGNTNNISNENDNDNDESLGNTPSSSNNCTPSPRTPNRELTKSEEENASMSNLIETDSNDNDNNLDDYVEIKSESKPTPQKSSRKPYKELLTEEEKRANHIASEQKRRNTIRAGFKELTDIIPTLKNVNNSKSTILFKAVDYIKYLERRNRNLKERAGLLEMRVEMEMRQGKRYHHHGGFGPAMGFGHQRVGPMPMGPPYGVMPNSLNGMNGMQIPIGQGHPPPQTHVMAPPMQNIYFVSADNQPMPSQQQILSAGGVVPSVNQSNNIFRGNMQIPIQQQPQQVNNDNNNGLVPE